MKDETPLQEGARYGSDNDPALLWTPGAPLPVFAELEGRNLALVDADEYRALVALRDAAAVSAPGGTQMVTELPALRAVFPMRVIALGVEAVAVPVADYERLARQDYPTASDRRNCRLTRLDKDAELQKFFIDRLGTEDVERIRHAAVEHFGAARVPSKSAVSRFVVRVRGERASAGSLNGR